MRQFFANQPASTLGLGFKRPIQAGGYLLVAFLPLPPVPEVDFLDESLLDLEEAPELPDPPDDELLESDPEVSLFARFFLFPDLKSVSYQPPPLRRNPAAETNLVRAIFPHSGHFLSGFSLSFCRVSN